MERLFSPTVATLALILPKVRIALGTDKRRAPALEGLDQRRGRARCAVRVSAISGAAGGGGEGYA